MRAIIYNAIKVALENVPEVKHVNLWNNQLSYTEDEQPFLTPAVFIEFATIQWQHHLHGIREAVITVNLHVVTDSRVGTWEEVMEQLSIPTKINATLHGLTASTPKGIMDALTATTSTTDNNFDELVDNIESYECHVTDNSAYKR